MIMKDKKIKYLTIIEYMLVIIATVSVFMCVVTDVRLYQRWIVQEMDVRTLFILKQLKTIEVSQQKQMLEMKELQQTHSHDWQQTKIGILAIEKSMQATLPLDKAKQVSPVNDVIPLQPAISLDETSYPSKPLSPQK